MSKFVIQTPLNSPFEKKIYLRIKKKVVEEEIKPLKRKIEFLEAEIKVLRKNYQKMINPSIKILSKLKI